MHPDWNISQFFVEEMLQRFLVEDAKDDTRSMTFYVESPQEIIRLFDATITYGKCKAISSPIYSIFILQVMFIFQLVRFFACFCTHSANKHLKKV